MPFLSKQLVGDRAEFPPRRDIAGRPPAAEALDKLDAPIHHRLLLLGRHGDRVLVGIAVHADLVAGIDHHLALRGEGVDRVAGNEPAGANAEAVEQLDQPRHADFAGKEAARDVARRILAPVRAEPAGDGVDVDADGAKYLLLAATARSWRRARAAYRLRRARRHQRAWLVARRVAGSCGPGGRTCAVIVGHDGARPRWMKHARKQKNNPLGGDRTDACNATVPRCIRTGKR